ncbi:serine hydrolase domain-containing protein [Janibacter sp. G1551]|uniref:serine hydrolase domain-containing protein n=1 Tax=Janibacter sp. G1551 TaxID=3420440 RepID=UPI003CFD67D8
MAFSEHTVRHLDHLAITTQSEGRVPGLAAGVARRGVLAWTKGVGAADLAAPGVAPDADTQYPIASNSKTFTAVAIMALRDEGKLHLDDAVGTHVPGAAHPEVTIRQLLAHTSGMQREPVGDVFETLEFPGRDALVDNWNAAERVGRPHTHWHYSNLAFSVLGEVVTRLSGTDTWFEAIRTRLLEPLGLTCTTLGVAPGGRAAGRYFVPPWSDVPVAEPDLLVGAVDAAAGLASTLTDMARWGGFIADPDPSILSPDTIEEMCQPQVVMDVQGWTAAFGLGLMLFRDDAKRTWVGHTGGWPGGITGVFTHRESATTGLVLMNSTSSPDPAAAAITYASTALDREPVEPEAWTPGTAVPAELAGVLGPWFSEGTEFIFSVRQGALEARAAKAPANKPPAVFERIEADLHRTVSGRERGELLRIRRAADGTVEAMNWATYLFTREPLAFGEWL